MNELDKALEEAQRVARRPSEDRLDGRLGDEAENAAARLMSAAGLSYTDAIRLVSALYWAGWNQGWTQARDKSEES
jgi:hypothetical protein